MAESMREIREGERAVRCEPPQGEVREESRDNIPVRLSVHSDSSPGSRPASSSPWPVPVLPDTVSGTVSKAQRVSLGKRLRRCPKLRCFGVFPNWEDYSRESQQAIRSAQRVFYPSEMYEAVFLAVGKEVFPRNHYDFMGNKIRQTQLFQLLGVSHPRTRLYYGRNRLERIRGDFDYPFIAKTPVGSSKGVGVYLIGGEDDLVGYLEWHRPAYIQEYLPIGRDLRIVVVDGKVVHAYWRIQCSGEFRNNVARGACISYEDIPEDALQFAEEVARRCRFDEVGLDVAIAHGRHYVLEANMAYGLEGFWRLGMDIYDILARAVCIRDDEEGSECRSTCREWK